MSVDFKKISRINDSHNEKKPGASKLMDMRKFKMLKKRIKDELEETETTEAAVDVVKSALTDCDPAEVVTCAVEILAEAVDVLQEKNDTLTEELADSRRTVRELKNKKALKNVADRKSFSKLKKQIKDELEETETTEDAVGVVVNYLDSQEPEDVVRAALEVIGETVDELLEMQ